MNDGFLTSVLAIAALVPAVLLGARGRPQRDGLYWALLTIAVAGPALAVVVKLSGAWHSDLATALWITVAATMAVFAAIVVLAREAWRLTPLVAAYMAVLGLLAATWHGVAAAHEAEGVSAWTVTHIGVSVATYALLTVAAVAALAALVQERALKARHPSALTRQLPPVAACDDLLLGLLIASESVLALGLLSGIALNWMELSRILTFDHKTVLSLSAFVVIGVLIAAHYRSGYRGRRAARWVLAAYLLLTLGYPGVKFVTDVLMA